MSRSADETRRAEAFPWLCAHRGLSKACPENTLPAFAAAMAVRAHEIEFDLWPSRDGVPVVCHDATVDRTTNGIGKVSGLAWADLRKLDAGVRTGEAWAGIRIPRFEEVLDLTGGRIGLNVHVKDIGPGGSMLRLVLDELRRRKLNETAYVALERDDAYQVACVHAPEIARCALEIGGPDAMIDRAIRFGCRRVQLTRAATDAQIRRARDAGLVCNLFWSDEPEEARRYVARGIDVVLTNCAHILVAGGFTPAQAPR